DPGLEEPVRLRAAGADLARGNRTRHVFEAVEALSGRGTAILVMSYWNPSLAYGPDAFARDLACTGGAGVITPDRIPDEGADWIAASETHGVDRSFLAAASAPPDRPAHAARRPRG